jgi:hypothetical protein
MGTAKGAHYSGGGHRVNEVRSLSRELSSRRWHAFPLDQAVFTPSRTVMS